MSEKVAAPKDKKIKKSKRARQVRLWVRAKFLSFRRYLPLDSDLKSPKTPTKTSSDLKVLTIASQLNTTSVREWSTCTRLIPEKPITDLE